MDFVPSLVQGAGTFVGTTLSGATIVSSSISGTTITCGTFVGGTFSGSTLVNAAINSGSTISVYALPTRQFVHVDKSGGSNQTITNNTFTKVDYTNTVFDAASVFSLSSDRMTPTVAGKYLVIAASGWNNAVASDFLSSLIYKNGSQVAQQIYENSNNNTSTVLSTAYVNMNGTTDYLEHFVRQVNGATTTRTIYASADETYFMAMWMSA